MKQFVLTTLFNLSSINLLKFGFSESEIDYDSLNWWMVRELGPYFFRHQHPNNVDQHKREHQKMKACVNQSFVGWAVF
jgi:uncharacterized protein YydD (DUF2326 family)